MKKILLLVICFATLVSCNKEKENERFNPISPLALNPGVNVKSDNPNHLSAGDIVKYAWTHNSSSWTSAGFNDGQRDYVNNRLLLRNDDVIKVNGSLETVWIEGKDIILERLITNVLGRIYYYPNIKFGVDIENRKILIGELKYDPEGIYGLEGLFELRDEIPFPEGFVPWPGFNGSGFQIFSQDTIAYIPNAVMREAEKNITEAYARGDYAACYKLFDTAITFFPITGAEWRALKEQGVE